MYVCVHACVRESERERARPADPARLFLPQNVGGFNLSLPSDLYQKLQVGKASLLITSQDGGVNHAVRVYERSQINDEPSSIRTLWHRKSLPLIQELQGKQCQRRLNKQRQAIRTKNV